MKLNVLLISNIPAPYFVNYANELGKYVDLTVLFELNNATDRESSWLANIQDLNFNCVFLNSKRTSNETGFSFKVKGFLKDKTFDRIIIANPTTPTGIYALLYCKAKKIPHIIQSEGGFQGSGKGLKEKFKKFLMKDAKYYLTGMGGNDDYFLMYGGTKDKLMKYNFTSSYSKDIDDNLISDEEKQELKKELGIKLKPTILFVGQFIYRKGIDVLLKAFKPFDNIANLILIGGNLNQEYSNIVSNLDLKNLTIIPFLSKDELRKYYRASDIFVLPTRKDTWGLVVNEAMEHGLPVISTFNCIAAKYLINDVDNGFIIESDNVDELVNKIKILLNDANIRKTMAVNNLNKIKNITLEKMAFDIFTYINDENLNN